MCIADGEIHELNKLRPNRGDGTHGYRITTRYVGRIEFRNCLSNKFFFCSLFHGRDRRRIFVRHWIIYFYSPLVLIYSLPLTLSSNQTTSGGHSTVQCAMLSSLRQWILGYVKPRDDDVCMTCISISLYDFDQLN